MDTIRKGDIAETQAIATFVKRGHMVSVPVSDHCPYDFVLEDSDDLHRIQVKYARLRDDGRKLRCSLKRSNPNANGTNDSYYSPDEIDAYVIYCPAWRRSIGSISTMHRTRTSSSGSNRR
jgi:hypothetical protein